MRDRRKPSSSIVIACLSLLAILGMWGYSQFEPPAKVMATSRSISGRVLDAQGEPVAQAQVKLFINGDLEEPSYETETQSDGSYLILIPAALEVNEALIAVERTHFLARSVSLTPAEVETLQGISSVTLDDMMLDRAFGAAFWVTTITFIGMLALIALERLHKTLAALAGVAVIFSVSAVGGVFSPDLFITDFDMALEHVDFEVIFLLMGMMIVIGIIEETGIFQWLAFRAYRLSGGRAWLLSLILMLIAAAASALLDNVTTMLLITPITLQIAMTMGIDPLSLLLPEVLAANVGGTSTLIGTPTNILIGSYADISFYDFLAYQTPGVVLALVGLIGYCLFFYRKEYRLAGARTSQVLLHQLEENARIEDPAKLKRAGIVFGALLLLFIFGEVIHLEPAVSAIIGAVAMLIWVHPEIEEIITVVDWTTLIFFIGLFMVIGALNEVGLIYLITEWIAEAVSGNLTIALFLVLWSAAVMSGVVDNIPFAAGMLPVVDFLTRTVPGANSQVLYYSLSLGAGFGGNSSLIGASENLVTAGIAGRAGYPITFKTFLKVGFPAMLLTVALGTIWLLIRF